MKTRTMSDSFTIENSALDHYIYIYKISNHQTMDGSPRTIREIDESNSEFT